MASRPAIAKIDMEQIRGIMEGPFGKEDIEPTAGGAPGRDRQRE